LFTQDEIFAMYGVVAFVWFVLFDELSSADWRLAFWLSMLEVSISLLTSTMVREVISSL
jgi:hypothetical protein